MKQQLISLCMSLCIFICSCGKNVSNHGSESFEKLYLRSADSLNIYCICTNYKDSYSPCLYAMPVTISNIVNERYKVLTISDKSRINFVKGVYKPFIEQNFDKKMLSTIATMAIEFVYKDGRDTLAFMNNNVLQLNTVSYLEYDFNVKKIFETIKADKPCPGLPNR